jgi:hypothetical protein
MTPIFTQKNSQATEPILRFDRPKTRNEAGVQRTHEKRLNGVSMRIKD